MSRSRALRGNAVYDAPRHEDHDCTWRSTVAAPQRGQPSVPTRRAGTRKVVGEEDFPRSSAGYRKYGVFGNFVAAID